ncbi:PREDICTED: uncharacterized protein LOC104809600 isoform X3 [Tarenaya hassleriana]|uniref:uncharacterized protein LOC104809600 isoform X3 n=1 Tax=Tarenaya hassleriana TaxID=28532 RepID=UPI00053C1CCC|nr:PREDICTED: uncharacterized protein LOC104809600 isoform X3 [Tarenaya hassleriana]
MRRIGFAATNSGAFTAKLLVSSMAISAGTLTLPSPHHLRLRFAGSPSLVSHLSVLRRRAFSISCFSYSSSASYLPALDDFSSSSGDLEKMDNQKVILKGMSYAELQEWVQSHGFRPGQALMLWKRLYRDNMWAHDVDELEGLNKDFKKMLCNHAELKALSLKDVRTASDGTKKILFTLDDGLVIETVVIPCDRGRTTVCVSSQVGCAMNCQFCYTGRMGLKRNLTAAEIVEQAVFARRLVTHEVGLITNVVFMGMGEPFHNIENVIRAANIMVDDQGLHFSPRKVTVSTSGLVPQLKRFLRESTCALAVSLNATTDEVRNWIMPINRKYKLAVLLETLREELRSKNNYKVLFEYVMLAGVNDSWVLKPSLHPASTRRSGTRLSRGRDLVAPSRSAWMMQRG